MKTHFFTALILALFCTTLRAELKWEQTNVELHPALTDKEAVGHFKYQNAGRTPIHFKAVRTSCGCTAAQTQKDRVEPGETGEITATFKIGDRTGTQIKSITVETDDAAHSPTVLTLKAVLADALTLTPTFVYWTAGEDANAKVIMAKAGKDFPAKSLTVTSSNPQFATEVEPGDQAGEWKISVKPKETARPIAAALTIRPDYPKDAPRLFYANASVTAGPASRSTAPVVK
jgi:hypothetical protein